MAFTIASADPKAVQKTADTLKAVGHPLRLRIIEYLEAYNELSVGQLQELLKIGQSAVSQQLALLKNKGIVRSRREGTMMFYAIENHSIVRLINYLTDTSNKEF